MILIEFMENQRMLTKYTHSQMMVKTDTGERGEGMKRRSRSRSRTMKGKQDRERERKEEINRK
jgi:hypothetical protein